MVATCPPMKPWSRTQRRSSAAAAAGSCIGRKAQAAKRAGVVGDEPGETVVAEARGLDGELGVEVVVDQRGGERNDGAVDAERIHARDLPRRLEECPVEAEMHAAARAISTRSPSRRDQRASNSLLACTNLKSSSGMKWQWMSVIMGQSPRYATFSRSSLSRSVALRPPSRCARSPAHRRGRRCAARDARSARRSGSCASAARRLRIDLEQQADVERGKAFGRLIEQQHARLSPSARGRWRASAARRR